jgi:hypothetical protein
MEQMRNGVRAKHVPLTRLDWMVATSYCTSTTTNEKTHEYTTLSDPLEIASNLTMALKSLDLSSGAMTGYRPSYERLKRQTNHKRLPTFPTTLVAA